MSELGRLIRKRVRAAIDDAGAHGGTNVTAAVNVGGEGHSASVYSDDDVTVITRDGVTEVIRRRDDERPPEAP
jgi:hypothetical protein